LRSSRTRLNIPKASRAQYSRLGAGAEANRERVRRVSRRSTEPTTALAGRNFVSANSGKPAGSRTGLLHARKGGGAKQVADAACRYGHRERGASDAPARGAPREVAERISRRPAAPGAPRGRPHRCGRLTADGSRAGYGRFDRAVQAGDRAALDDATVERLSGDAGIGAAAERPCPPRSSGSPGQHRDAQVPMRAPRGRPRGTVGRRSCSRDAAYRRVSARVTGLLRSTTTPPTSATRGRA